MTEPNVLRILKCHNHGYVHWVGQVVCNECGRVFQTKEPDGERYAPEMCPCGARLMPSPDEALGNDRLGATTETKGGGLIKGDIQLNDYAQKEWSARSICPRCYKVVVKKHNGRIPGWKPTKHS